MAATVVRPSFKFIQIGFVAVFVVIIAAAVVHYMYLRPQGQPAWLPAVAAILILWPLAKALRRRFTKLIIDGDRLYSESGALSKQTRIIQIPKIQDVRMHQSLGQRMLGIGDIAIETAGEASRLTFPNVDSPRALCEQILALAGHDHGTPHI